MNETTQKLVAALRAAGATEVMIRKAEAAQYDDYLADSAFPISDLVNDCRKQGLLAIANRAIDGEFDATKEESDAWAASEDGQAAFRELVQPRRTNERP